MGMPLMFNQETRETKAQTRYLEAAHWWLHGIPRNTRSEHLLGRAERSCTRGTRSGSACLQSSGQSHGRWAHKHNIHNQSNHITVPSQSYTQFNPILLAPTTKYQTVSNPAYATQSHINQTSTISVSMSLAPSGEKKRPLQLLPIPNPAHAIRFPHTDRPCSPARLIDPATERRTLPIPPARHRNIKRRRIYCVRTSRTAGRRRRQQTPPRTNRRN